jgi:hypothetical protein
MNEETRKFYMSDEGQFYIDIIDIIVNSAKTQRDRMMLWSIRNIINAQVDFRRRQTLWNHFEKTAPWELKQNVAEMHVIFNEMEEAQAKAMRAAIAKPKAVVAEAELRAV